jgi:hypothetical protein
VSYSDTSVSLGLTCVGIAGVGIDYVPLSPIIVTVFLFTSQGLAVTDTLVLANVFVLRTMRYLFVPTSPSEIWWFEWFHSRVYPGLFPMAYVLRLINTWLTVLLTVDRYIATCKPLHAQHLCTMRRTYVLIAIVVVTSVAFSLPRFFELVAINVVFIY